MNLNKAMIIGNLARDPDVKTIPSGATVATFSVATNFVWNDAQGQKQERVEFHNIVAWRKLGEICGQYLHKGSKVFIEGRLQTRDWTGQDGVKRYRTEIIAENMIMLDRAGSAGRSSGFNEQPPTPSSEPIINSNEPVAGREEGYSEEEIRVENIPF